MKNKKNISILVLVVPFLILLLIYPFLPEKIPSRYHLNGEPPSYMAKEFIFLTGFLPYFVYRKYLSRKSK